MKRHYDNTFKRKFVNLYSTGTPAAVICSENSIPRSTLYLWIKEYKKTKVNKSILISARELDVLRKKLNSIERENEILKECNCSRKSPLDGKIKAISELDGKYNIHALPTITASLEVQSTLYSKKEDAILNMSKKICLT